MDGTAEGAAVGTTVGKCPGKKLYCGTDCGCVDVGYIARTTSMSSTANAPQSTSKSNMESGYELALFPTHFTLFTESASMRHVPNAWKHTSSALSV